jgi:hypothetical protein
MLSQGDGAIFKGPGIFFYTKGMPVILLENLLTLAKLLNGHIGIVDYNWILMIDTVII